jgi:multiple sugar transport system permease protein
MKETSAQRVLLVIGATLAGLYFLAPVAYMAITSLARSPEYLAPGGVFRFTLDNYRAILTGENLHFLAYLRNSLIVSAIAAALCIGMSCMAAYAITRIRFPGNMTVMLGVLALSMFPQISLAGYLFRLISRLDWINTYQGLIFPYTAWVMPLSLWILVSYFSQLPPDLDKAARIDGCGHWRILTRVLLPVALPGVFSTALLAFIFAFNEFMFALILTTDFQARTVPVGIALFEGLHGEIPWSTIMAASVVTTAPVVALTLLFQRYIVQGLTRGALKE